MAIFNRTQEQNDIALLTQVVRGNFAISAVAGSGKTTTALDLIENFIPRIHSVLYMAFNAKIKKSTEEKFKKKGFQNASAKTFNGFAYGAYMKRFGIKNINTIRMDEAKYLRLASAWIAENMSHLTEEERDIASEILDNLIHFTRVNTTYPKSGSRELVVLTAKNSKGGAVYTPIDSPYFESEHDAEILETIAWKYDVFDQLDNPDDELKLLRAVPVLLHIGKDMIEKENEDGEYVCTFTDQVYWFICERWNVYKAKWVIVDEAQDLSPMFRALVDLAVFAPGHVIIIGDPRQAIYAFTGADSSGFQNSVSFWSAEKVMPLTFSFRCPVKVAELAREWVPEFQAAPNAIEGEVLETSVEKLVRDALPGEAIISRVRAPMIPMWQKLVAAGKPAILVGSDVSRQIVKVLERVAKRKGFEFKNLAAHLRDYQSTQLDKMVARKKSRDEIDGFIDQMAAVTGAVDAIHADDMNDLIVKIKAIFAKNDEEIKESDAVLIMTGHQSKGLEFDTVYILTPNQFPMRHPEMTEDQQTQEMNLRYVVQTRAMKRLILVTGKTEEPSKEPVAPTVPENQPVTEEVVEGEIVANTAAQTVDEIVLLLQEVANYRQHIGTPLMQLEWMKSVGDQAEKLLELLNATAKN